jgi:hypothetical protein
MKMKFVVLTSLFAASGAFAAGAKRPCDNGYYNSRSVNVCRDGATSVDAGGTHVVTNPDGSTRVVVNGGVVVDSSRQGGTHVVAPGAAVHTQP